MKMSTALETYLRNLDRERARGVATEHSYRPALKQLLEALDPGVRAVNEPKRDACGAPDYLVSRRDLTLGYIEAKDIGVDLDTVARSGQLHRYFAALENLILSDYLEFRWYVNGELRLAAQPAKFLGSKLTPVPDGIAETEALLRVYLNATQYFAPVPEAVWTFSVGGYQPAEKWLKDRRERVLSHADLQHYKHLLTAQRETLRVMGEIDETLPVWPLQSQ